LPELLSRVSFTHASNTGTQPELGPSVTEAARRAQIIGATIETIGELGYTKASFARIKERADLGSTRIISYHFGTKAGLMQAVLTTVTGIKDEFLVERTGGGTDRASMLRAYIESEVAFLSAYPQCVRVMLEFAASGDDQEGWSMSASVVREFRTGRLVRQLRQGQRKVRSATSRQWSSRCPSPKRSTVWQPKSRRIRHWT
jgi:AcrR family transcriptional regulator